MSTTLKRSAVLLLALLMLFGLFPWSAFEAQAKSDGYTVITTAAELDTVVRNNLSGQYKLGNDIDLSTYSYNSSTWTSKSGWQGIGTSLALAFKGTFDGDGHTIKGLWNYCRGSNQGLFGWLKGATIKNLNIELSSKGMTGGGERMGALAGDAYDGTTIDNVNIVGAGKIQGCANYVAGLVGVLYQSSIMNSSATDVTVAGCSYVGGLVGYAYGSSTISGSYTKNVNATSSASYLGGFIGATQKTTIRKCYVMGTKATASASYAGGFVGAAYGCADLTSCYVFDADVRSSYYAGGFAGTIYGCSTVQKSCAYGEVRTTCGYIAGGFAGEATNATLMNCYAQANVYSSSSGAGGLIAYSAGSTSVYNCYAAGKVSAKLNTNVGAFVGHSTVKFLGTNYYDCTLAAGLNAYGSSGTKSGSTSAYPQGKNTATMMKQATFVGWDFNSIWRIDENETYPYFWDWGWCKTTATVTYDKNNDDATGTMAVQTVQKNVATALNANQFALEEYLFLGWSTTPNGDVVYQDGASVTLTEDITLYAVWATAEVYAYYTAVPSTAYPGDTITYTITLGNENINRSLTWYNVTAELYLSEHVSLDSISLTLNGTAVTPSYTFDNTSYTLTLDLGNIAPGQEYVITVKVTALASAQGQTISLGVWADGSLTPGSARSAFSASDDVRIQIELEGADTNILAPETAETSDTTESATVTSGSVSIGKKN